MSILPAWQRDGYRAVAEDIQQPPPEEDGPPPSTTPAPPAWVTHPGATVGGEARTVNGLTVVGHRLILAYGAYFGGSHPVLSVDLSTGEPITGPTAPTEGFWVVRNLDGVIYLPWQDPTGPWHEPQGYTYSTDGGATWFERRVAPAYHWYDMQHHGGALFLAGSGPDIDGAQSALIVRSDDDGATWQESLRVRGGTQPRFYHLSEAGGLLWANASNADTSRSYQLAPDGTWMPSSVSVGIAARDARWSVSAAGVSYGTWDAFDGSRTVTYPRRLPSCADATHVYAVNQGSGTIDRAPLLTPEDTEVTWSPWLDLGEGMTGHVATTAVLHDGHVYVGGTRGRIWRYPAPA